MPIRQNAAVGMLSPHLFHVIRQHEHSLEGKPPDADDELSPVRCNDCGGWGTARKTSLDKERRKTIVKGFSLLSRLGAILPCMELNEAVAKAELILDQERYVQQFHIVIRQLIGSELLLMCHGL